MSVLRRVWHRPTLALSLLVLGAGLVSGCAGSTTVTEQVATGKYDMAVRMDPLTLNPPALGTLTFSVTTNVNGTAKPVTQFEPVSDALMHTIILHKDLLYFRHSFTDRLLMDAASVSAAFPRTGTYNVWTFYKPAQAPVQVYTMTISTGEPSGGPQLSEDYTRMKVASGIGVTLVHGAGDWRAGQPVQFAFRATERGYPVADLWPYLGAPGHLWIVDDAQQGTPILAHEVGSAGTEVFASGTPGTGTGQNTESQFPNSGQIGGSDQKLTAPMSTSVAPTYAPGLASALASITAAPVSTLLPVQQTPQSSILGTPAVRPAIGYGPVVAFTHTFPHPGLYKMWLEVQYQGRVVTTDFVVPVK